MLCETAGLVQRGVRAGVRLCLSGGLTKLRGRLPKYPEVGDANQLTLWPFQEPSLESRLRNP